jgi:hypothetical protein
MLKCRKARVTAPFVIFSGTHNRGSGRPALLDHPEYDGGEERERHDRGSDVQSKSELHRDLLY